MDSKYCKNRKIISKIKRCLALAESGNKHESSIAKRQADVLISKHGINLQKIEHINESVCLFTANSDCLKPYHVLLVEALASIHAVEARSVYSQKQPSILSEPTRIHVHVDMTGSRPHIQALKKALLLANFQLIKDREAYLVHIHGNTSDVNRERRMDYFSLGWVSSIFEQFKDLIEQGSGSKQTSEPFNKAMQIAQLSEAESRAVCHGFEVGKLFLSKNSVVLVQQPRIS